jgi:hypothetical protein
MGILDNKNSNMKDEKVYSPIEDKQIRTNLNESPIWKQNYHETDLVLAKSKHPVLFEYVIRFDGLKPIMVTKVSKVA